MNPAVSKGKRRRWPRLVLAGILALYGWFVCVFASVFDMIPAVQEYFLPTSVANFRLPAGCIETGEAAPRELMDVIDTQKQRLDLRLQEVKVCRSTRRLLEYESRIAGSLPYPTKVESESSWQNDFGGCCTARSGRHFAVEVSDPREHGSIYVRGLLIQSRWDYLGTKLRRVKLFVLGVGAIGLLFGATTLLLLWRLWLAMRWLLRRIFA